MKAVGPTILHKTDIGGIALGLTGDEAVRRPIGTCARVLATR
jgi:acyl-CoA synthetase (NDP forming)